jgi:hypothetical protein
MARIKPVLGRGLASLIPRQAAVPPLPLGGQDDGVTNDIIASIALDRIQRNPYQPRRGLFSRSPSAGSAMSTS